LSIEVHIDAESVNSQVVAAITQSVIGDEMKKAITKALESSYSRASVVESVVNQAVAQAVRDVIEDDYKDQIREAVKKTLEEDSLQSVIDAATAALIDKIDKVSRGY
jgi:DNA-binding FrmR family transcriptional regulator